jgi:hypothetical protein
MVATLVVTLVAFGKRPKPCWCGGYWFPHRKGGGACEHSPRADYYIALRYGATQSEAMEWLSSAQIEKMFPLNIEPSSNDDDIPL